ncbi:head completion/stabilization protein [Yersinia enterocolitica]|uniref:head completion/stabilization protein n=1 Tax=Yersinia TaxID=629 RepID=UPI001C60E463|nr:MULTISPECIES: head completion/stabilization protein [Yersinia]EKN3753324.1 head completion/stabilization protein [Yersinia enterocolitica]EKN3797796.1 head completion/stabilization protein [Yersinia enterocolitica]EKN3878624.1 head completion/stabilization protein [Yersinia enterocolitica]EKN4176536.1 head completion/stabilization protein [Yersinia enterocolitica]ELI8163429.1 head completion/stabilization protein [Yersinia enterocolitica]
MTTVVIPAPRPDKTAEPVIENTFFWPAVDPIKLRELLRLEGTVTAERLRFTIKGAMAEINAELFDYRRQQMAIGCKALGDVQAEQMDGENMQLAEYQRAVCAVTAALLAERYRGYDASARGDKRAEAIENSVGEWWRDARHSIRNITGQPHNIVDLI